MFAQREGHVVEHVHVGEQCPELEQHAHATAGSIELDLAELADVLAVEQHLALLGALLAADQAQHGGLAATRSAHDGRDLAARYVQRNILEDLARAAVAEMDVLQLHQGRSRHGDGRGGNG